MRYPIEGAGTLNVFYKENNKYSSGRSCDQEENLQLDFTISTLDGNTNHMTREQGGWITNGASDFDWEHLPDAVEGPNYVPRLTLYFNGLPSSIETQGGACRDFINLEAGTEYRRSILLREGKGPHYVGISEFDSAKGVATFTGGYEEEISSLRLVIKISKVDYEKPDYRKPTVGKASKEVKTEETPKQEGGNSVTGAVEAVTPPGEITEAAEAITTPGEKTEPVEAVTTPGEKTEAAEAMTPPGEKTIEVQDTEKLVWPKANSSILPVPDLTQNQIDFVNSGLKAEEELIERLRNPSFLEELHNSFQSSVNLYEFDFEWAPGLNVQISSRPEDVAIWGAEVVISPGVEKAKGKVKAFFLSPEALEAISNTLTVVSTTQAWYDIKQPPKEQLRLSGVRIIGPFTVRVAYAPELIPDGYSEEDLGMFRAVVKEGTVALIRLRNILVDQDSHTISGKVDDLSVITVGVLTEPVESPTSPGEALTEPVESSTETGRVLTEPEGVLTEAVESPWEPKYLFRMWGAGHLLLAMGPIVWLVFLSIFGIPLTLFALFLIIPFRLGALVASLAGKLRTT